MAQCQDGTWSDHLTSVRVAHAKRWCQNDIMAGLARPQARAAPGEPGRARGRAPGAPALERW